MTKKTIELLPDDQEKIAMMHDFNKRWDICCNENIPELKARCLMVISKYIDDGVSLLYSCNPAAPKICNDFYYDLCVIVGANCFDKLNPKFEYTELYDHINSFNLSLQNDYNKFLYIIEALMNYENLLYNKSRFAKSISEAAKLSDANFKIISDEGKYIILPSNIEFLDNSLIIDNLSWMNKYSNSKEHFLKALKFSREEKYYRNIIDELRISLEFLFKQLFNNGKSLENQIPNIGTYFKENNISTYLMNMYVKLIESYTNYNNDNAKHGDKVSEMEIDYLIYLTGTFIRFIIQIEISKKVV